MADGAQGLQGVLGTQGVEGNYGNQGNQGNQGPLGYQGIQGIPGTQGPQGHQAPMGPQGNQGIQGFRGENGYPGRMGIGGSAGTLGNQGNQGDLGAQGVQACAGRQGPLGVLGVQGYQGPGGYANAVTTYYTTGTLTFSSTSFADITGFNNISYEVGASYVIEGAFYVGDGGGGVKVKYVGGTSDGLRGFLLGFNAPLGGVSSYFNGAEIDIVTDGADGVVFIKATLKNVQDSTVGKFQLAKTTASGTDSSLYEGSYLKVTKIYYA